MPFIQTEHLNIHYETAGAGQNVLVLVHGNFASWRWWQPVFDRLPANYRPTRLIYEAVVTPITPMMATQSNN